MKYLIVVIASSFTLISCAHEVVLHRELAAEKMAAAHRGIASESSPAQEPTQFLPSRDNGNPWNAADQRLKRGELTIWKLQEMAVAGKFAEINELFNHGLTMDHLPMGYSAGTGVPFPTTDASVKKMLDWLTGLNWRGKIFYDSGKPNVSHGFNRILKFPPGREVLPTAKFVTTMIDINEDQHDFDQPELARGATSNFVVLNYADPVAGVNWPVEHALTLIPVYDVMVAVPGKYGPLYVGKTWLGKYDKKTHVFHANNPDSLIAYYFLDFNEEALNEQKANHWAGGKETKKPFTDAVNKK